jgi:hypothetical protein
MVLKNLLFFCFLLLPLLGELKAQVLEIEQISTPNKAISYSIKTSEDRFDGKVTKLVQFNNTNGLQEKFEIDGKQGFGAHLLSVICDNEYLYFVTSKDGNEAHGKKKVVEKLILNRIHHKTKAHSTFIVETPAIEGGDESVFWSFIGNNSDTQFYSYKRIDEKLDRIKFVVIGVSQEGKIVSTTEFFSSLSSGKFTRPSYNNSEPSSSMIVRRLDYREKKVTNDGGGMRSAYLITYALPTAHGQVIYDQRENRFLVYGLFGDSPHKAMASQYRGLYLAAYDLEGNKKWSILQPAPPKLIGEPFFRIHGTSTDRGLEVFSVPENRIVFIVAFKNFVAPFLFSSDGNLIKSDLIKSTAKSSFDIISFLK